MTIRSTTTMAPSVPRPCCDKDTPALDPQHLTPSSPPPPRHQNGSNDTPREDPIIAYFPLGTILRLRQEAQRRRPGSALHSALHVGQARHDLSVAEGKWGLELESRQEVPPPPAAQALSNPVHRYTSAICPSIWLQGLGLTFVHHLKGGSF